MSSDKKPVSMSDAAGRESGVPPVLKNFGGVAAGYRNYVFHVSGSR